jgi:2-oxoglutarate/2-oxoacid ferredoxin oxidoreductase subunit beta
VKAGDIVVHDAYTDDPEYAYALSRLSDQDLTYTVTGIVRAVNRPTYDDAARDQVARAKEEAPPDLQQLLDGRSTWTVS